MCVCVLPALCSHRPDQDLGVVKDFLVDSLTGESSPRLHIVGFHTSTTSLRHWLVELAEETHAHYHSVEECESVEGEMVSVRV